MCGCMLMHAMMDHQEHQTVIPAPNTPTSNTIPIISRNLCQHCGFPLQHDFAFCPGCGMDLRSAKCPACGQEVNPTWGACAYCGAPLGELQTQHGRD